MTFFVDANVFVYSATRGEYRQACSGAIRAIARGDGLGRTSTAALEEVWFTEWRGQAGNLDGLTARAHAVMAPLLPVTDDIFRRALALDAPSAGTNDRLHAATCLANDIEVILSADTDFDDIPGVRRVDPLARDEVAQLLGEQP